MIPPQSKPEPAAPSASSTDRRAASNREAIFHFALGAAAIAVVGGVFIQPAEAGSELARAQLQIARIGMFVLAFGLLALWLVRAPLARDLHAMVDRWQSTAVGVTFARLVPASGSQAVTRVLWGLLVVWAATLAYALASTAPWVEPLTDENGVTETITVIAYLAAGGLAVDLVRQSFGSRAVGGGRRWILIGLAAFCLLVAGEETDWGQTYFRYETPDSFEVANIQGDFSLHNLAPPEAVPGTRWANWMLRFIGWGVGGLLPLLLLTSAAFRRFIYALDVPIPPVWSMAVLFLAACLPELEGVYNRNNIGSELREFSIAVAILVWVWACWLQHRERREDGI